MKVETEEILINPNDYAGLIELMDTFGGDEYNYAAYGKNENDEDTYVEIYPDRIYVKTYQNNGWTRLNIYHRDFTTEETFEGRWNDDDL